MNNFNFFSPTRIIFGKNKIEDLGNIAARYGKKCMLVTTNKNEPALKDLYVKAINILESANIAVLHFDEVLPNPPIDIIEKAIALANENNIDFLVGLGGGSSIDTAKSISIFHEVDKINWSEAYQKYTSPFTMYEKISSKKIPLIAIPTTAGTGSEVTQAMMVSEYENNEKNCIFHNEAYPEVALIDPTLCLTIPKRLTAATGFDAFCHAFESYLRDEASDITKAFGIIAIKDIINTLPKLVNDLGNYEYRETMSKAACFAGISLANAAATLP
ncbi:MAG: iron-containing alcohol dehydrogenase, partial [Christensenellaceae bacterium]|nr:iron-containing alcohol dehydrogenase [Christensenellaceae bacterium]